MGEKTKIAWTHHTFNPWRGCSKVHAGCANCYAEREAKRFPANRGRWGPNGTRVRASDAMWREPLKWNAAAQAAGERRRVFCASLADVFEDWRGPIVCPEGARLGIYPRRSGEGHDYRIITKGASRLAIMEDLRIDLFILIDATPWLDWLLLTKRPENIPDMWMARGDDNEPVLKFRRENVWLLTSVSDQATADLMIPRLIESARDLVPVLGASAEPLLGPIDFTDWIGCDCSASEGHCDICLSGGLDWIILGGESGPRARTCDLAWMHYGMTQCKRAGVSCFMKQLGADPVRGSRSVKLADNKGGDPLEWPEDLRVRQFPDTALKGAMPCAN